MEGIERMYEQARHALADRRGRRVREKPFTVNFVPYAGLNARIWDRRDHYEVRLSELLRQAPMDAHESLARILIGKIDRRLRATREDARPYRAWSRRPEVDRQSEASRRARGRKRCLPAQGQVHDLEQLFDRINRDRFQGALHRPRLGWSPSPGRSLYGHHDPAHDTIVINRLLDHPRVPQAVVMDVLHHEMLHVKHGIRYGAGGRRIFHPRAFRQDEASYPAHAEAKGFLDDLARRRIRLRIPRGQAPARTPLRQLLQASLSIFVQRAGCGKALSRTPPPPGP